MTFHVHNRNFRKGFVHIRLCAELSVHWMTVVSECIVNNGSDRIQWFHFIKSSRKCIRFDSERYNLAINEWKVQYWIWVSSNSLVIFEILEFFWASISFIDRFRLIFHLLCISFLANTFTVASLQQAHWLPRYTSTTTMNRTEESDWVKCPYNATHLVPYQRMPYHLIKCKANYKGPPLDTCPFNATHLVAKGTLSEHFETCVAYYHANRERFERQT